MTGEAETGAQVGLATRGCRGLSLQATLGIILPLLTPQPGTSTLRVGLDSWILRCPGG